MSIIQTQTIKQSQRLTPQQIQLINILSLPTIAVEQYIANEMALNPALEFDMDEPAAEEQDLSDDYDDFSDDDDAKIADDYDQTDYMDKSSLDDYKSELTSNAPEERTTERVFTEAPHFTFSLIEQLHLLPITDEEKELGEYVIHSLDDDGYLRRTISDLADELSFLHNKFVEEHELEAVLEKIHTLEPLGIGARDLKECLLLQLEGMKLKTKEYYLAKDIISTHLEKLGNKEYDFIKSDLNIDDEDFEDTLEEIRKLNPVPAGCASENSGKAIPVQPDFTAIVYGDKVELYLNNSNHPPLKVSDTFSEMLQEYSGSKNAEMKAASGFIKNKIDHAKAFIEALQQREKMMTKIAQAIVRHQHQYFITGDESDLKPMILKNIAEETESDISTISRIVNSKYIQTNHGMILMKKLFVQGMTTLTGDIVSTTEIKKALLECINCEDKSQPLSDEEISNLLTGKQYVVARRTVAKYREELNIPNKNFRKAA